MKCTDKEVYIISHIVLTTCFTKLGAKRFNQYVNLPYEDVHNPQFMFQFIVAPVNRLLKSIDKIASAQWKKKNYAGTAGRIKPIMLLAYRYWFHIMYLEVIIKYYHDCQCENQETIKSCIEKEIKNPISESEKYYPLNSPIKVCLTTFPEWFEIWSNNVSADADKDNNPDTFVSTDVFLLQQFSQKLYQNSRMLKPGWNLKFPDSFNLMIHWEKIANGTIKWDTCGSLLGQKKISKKCKRAPAAQTNAAQTNDQQDQQSSTTKVSE